MAPLLEVKNLFASYGKKEILKDVSLCFEKGMITSVTGPNGCGKTTLLNTLTGIVRKKSGDIFIDGESISQFKEKALAKKISYLAQAKTVPDMRVGQLVLHGRFPHTGFSGIYGKSDRDAAVSAMEKMDILHLADKSLITLSGGMRQNVFIAMALCQDTDYILLDEPTTYLDIENQLKLLKLLRTLASEGKGIITVLHDLPLALCYSDKVAVMKDGKIASFDNPENIYSSGVIKSVFNAEIKKGEDGKSFYFEYER